MDKKINNRERLKLIGEILRWTVYYLIVWFLSWMAMLLAISRPVMDSFVVKADTLLELLEGYAGQQLFLTIIISLVAVVLIGFAVVAVVFQTRDWRNPKYEELLKTWKRRGGRGPGHPAIIIIGLAMLAGFPMLFLKDEKPLEQYKRFREEITAIEENRLESAVVCFSGLIKYDGLDSLGEAYADTVARYTASGIKSTGEKLPAGESFYVPLCLDFSPHKGYGFRENQSVDVNEEPVILYYITYTPRYHLVTTVEIFSEGKTYPLSE